MANSKQKLDPDKIFKLTSRINSTESLDSLLDTIMDTARDLLNVEGASLLLYDRERSDLVFCHSRGLKSESLQNLRVPKGKGIAGTVLETLKPIIVNDANNDPRIYRVIDESIGFVTKNLVCVPMIAQGEIQGVLEAVNTLDREQFDDEDLNTFLNLSEIAAIAIRNRLLIEDLQARLDDIRNLLYIVQTLSTITELGTFIHTTFRLIIHAMKCERISLVLKSQKTGHWFLAKSIGFQLKGKKRLIDISRGVISRVLKTGQPIFSENKLPDNLIFPRRNIYRNDSFISIPIKNEFDIEGVLSISNRKDGKPFSKNDLDILILILHYFRETYNSLRSRERKQKLDSFKRDLEIAGKIQKYSLPKIPELLGGLEIIKTYLPSKEVGGDFYDLIYHSEFEFSFIIADVSGKGISAALFMEFSKNIISDEVARFSSPSRALMNSNTIIQEKFYSMMYVEVMLAKINTRTKTLTIASAGHHRQFLYRTSSDQLFILKSKGLPLGTRLQNFEIDELEISYEDGDLLFLYTDGITETRNQDKEFFGEERLSKLIRNHAKDPLPRIKTIIKKATDAFRGNRELEDDFTFILIRLH